MKTGGVEWTKKGGPSTCVSWNNILDDLSAHKWKKIRWKKGGRRRWRKMFLWKWITNQLSSLINRGTHSLFSSSFSSFPLFILFILSLFPLSPLSLWLSLNSCKLTLTLNRSDLQITSETVTTIFCCLCNNFFHHCNMNNKMSAQVTKQNVDNSFFAS